MRGIVMTDTLAELEAIRARHVACGHIEQWPDFDSFEAHTDRGTLIRFFEKAQAELAEVREAIKRQAAAVRNLQTSEDSQINVLRKRSQQAHIAASTLDSERAMNAILTEENERLRAELAEVREAAGPFLGEWIARDHLKPGPDIDHWPIGGSALTYGDLRRLAAALTRAQGESS
jgi:hypothetical protein